MPTSSLPDNDEAGRSHARKVADSLAGYVKSLRLLRLPALSEKGDVSDWLAAGKTADDLKALARHAPVWNGNQDLEAFLAEHDATVYRYFAHWWDKLPSADVRTLPSYNASVNRVGCHLLT